MKKRILALLLTAAMALSVAGCGSSDAPAKDANAQPATQATEEKTEEKKEQTEKETEEKKKPEDGTAFQTERVHEAMVADIKISTEWIEMEEPVLVDDIFLSLIHISEPTRPY